MDFAINELKAVLGEYNESFFDTIAPEFAKSGNPKPSSFLEITTSQIRRFPFLELQVDNFDFVEELMSRCVMIKHIFQLFAETDTFEELHAELEGCQSFLDERSSEETFAFRVSGSGKSLK